MGDVYKHASAARFCLVHENRRQKSCSRKPMTHENTWRDGNTVETSRYYKGNIQQASNVCSLLPDRNEHVAVRLGSSLANQRASLSRLLASKCRQENGTSFVNKVSRWAILEEPNNIPGVKSGHWEYMLFLCVSMNSEIHRRLESLSWSSLMTLMSSKLSGNKVSKKFPSASAISGLVFQTLVRWRCILNSNANSYTPLCLIAGFIHKK